MCTVTYFPHPAGFMLTHNRDEAPGRSPQGLEKEKITQGTEYLLFPRDTGAGGSWIAASQRGRTACLLNGAFVKHQHRPPYRRSRGLVLIDFFQWNEPDAFFADYGLEGIEPFTFLFFQIGRVTEFRWDGALRHRRDLPADQPQLWSSATLYPPEMQRRREQIFHDWLASRSSLKALSSALRHLHRTGSVGDPENDFVMNRSGRVMTVSITQVVHSGDRLRMFYHNLIAEKHAWRGMKILTDERRKT